MQWWVLVYIIRYFKPSILLEFKVKESLYLKKKLSDYIKNLLIRIKKFSENLRINFYHQKNPKFWDGIFPSKIFLG